MEWLQKESNILKIDELKEYEAEQERLAEVEEEENDAGLLGTQNIVRLSRDE